MVDASDVHDVMSPSEPPSFGTHAAAQPIASSVGRFRVAFHGSTFRAGSVLALAHATDVAPILSLVLPCFNGGDTLRTTLAQLPAWIDSRPVPTEVILVDDGSRPDDAAMLRASRTTHPRIRLVRNIQNRGKGSAVRIGLRAARGSICVFNDCDLAYPLSQVDKIYAALQAGADVAIANRFAPASQHVIDPKHVISFAKRHVGSRIFNRLVQTVLLPGIRDTQAGLKGFTARAARLVADRLTVDGFGFDLELLMIAQAHRLQVAQVPVQYIHDGGGSSVRYARDASRMVRDLFRIRSMAAQGRYA
jgi:dolichyl-phosphate beta-glucosyltransferase